jgi:hypothetical protein
MAESRYIKDLGAWEVPGFNHSNRDKVFRRKPLNVEGTKLQGYACLVLRKDKYVHGPMKAFLKLLQETFKPPKDTLRRCFEPR